MSSSGGDVSIKKFSQNLKRFLVVLKHVYLKLVESYHHHQNYEIGMRSKDGVVRL